MELYGLFRLRDPSNCSYVHKAQASNKTPNLNPEEEINSSTSHQVTGKPPRNPHSTTTDTDSTSDELIGCQVRALIGCVRRRRHSSRLRHRDVIEQSKVPRDCIDIDEMISQLRAGSELNKIQTEKRLDKGRGQKMTTSDVPVDCVESCGLTDRRSQSRKRAVQENKENLGSPIRRATLRVPRTRTIRDPASRKNPCLHRRNEIPVINSDSNCNSISSKINEQVSDCRIKLRNRTDEGSDKKIQSQPDSFTSATLPSMDCTKESCTRNQVSTGYRSGPLQLTSLKRRSVIDRRNMQLAAAAKRQRSFSCSSCSSCNGNNTSLWSVVEQNCNSSIRNRFAKSEIGAISVLPSSVTTSNMNQHNTSEECALVIGLRTSGYGESFDEFSSSPSTSKNIDFTGVTQIRDVTELSARERISTVEESEDDLKVFHSTINYPLHSTLNDGVCSSNDSVICKSVIDSYVTLLKPIKTLRRSVSSEAIQKLPEINEFCDSIYSGYICQNSDQNNSEFDESNANDNVSDIDDDDDVENNSRTLCDCSMAAHCGSPKSLTNMESPLRNKNIPAPREKTNPAAAGTTVFWTVNEADTFLRNCLLELNNGHAIRREDTPVCLSQEESSKMFHDRLSSQLYDDVKFAAKRRRVAKTCKQGFFLKRLSRFNGVCCMGPNSSSVTYVIDL